MEKPSKLITKKRKRPSSEPCRIFTRSQAQIYHHRNRSGRARVDSFPHPRSNQVGIFSKTQFLSLDESPIRSQNFGDKDDWSRTPIKDLRTRRVFSPASITEQCGYGEGIKEYTKTIEEGSEGIVFQGNCLDNIDIKRNSDSVNVGEQKTRTNDAKEEESVQATPPDADIFGCHYDDKVAFLSQPLMEGHRDSEGFQDKNMNNASASRSVPRPRARVQVFKAPGSFGYRRLLPYLMDITKDNLSALGKVNCPKIESQLVLMDRTKRDNTVMEDQSVDSGAPSQDKVTTADGNNLDSTSIVRSVDSSKQFDPSTRASLPTSSFDECYPKSLVKGEIEAVGAGDSCEDKGLINSDTYLPSRMIDTPFIENSGDQRPVGGVQGGNDLLDAIDTNREISLIVENRASAVDETSLIVENHSSEVDGVCQDCGALKLNEAGFIKELDLDQSNQSNLDFNAQENGETSDGGFSTELGIDRTNQLGVNLPDTEEKGKLSDTGKKDDDNSSLLSDELDYSNNESVHLTGSDGSNFSKTEKLENVANRVSSVFQSTGQVLGKPFLGSGPRYNQCAQDKRVDCNSRSKLGLNPCSRLRLFKTPGSLSYRRLLPHLINISKDLSGTSGNMHCSKLDKGSEDLNSSSNFDLHKALDETCNNTTNQKKSERFLENSNAFSVLRPKDEQYKQLLQLPGFHGITADSSPKSILRRNPRGCRGSCCCLNCTSFRLNAEKAFDFSKNLMLDAEEVAFDLIKENSELCDMLEKSAVSSDLNPNVCINQVKEACRKASEAAELARTRLEQMNYDLSIHCRITVCWIQAFTISFLLLFPAQLY
ncbi:hypothetical protein K2173_011585 [Erythroxylum novogranatense]|uniref:Uncharacterized protein n=1 Tax=Erythroxylum novogranatense TaxID=1862640 RepID=A0AAV8U4W5_9ROSI|nr:hypothetical protein K2173_011585 [Erythroxylum novogranatense]